MAKPATKGRKAVEKTANALKTLKVTYVKATDLKPNSYNPNRQSPHDFELLLRSMREDGFTQPIVAQSKTSEIVDGEHRWRAALELGYEEIPVVFVDMTIEQMRIATLRHNRARGSEDIELSAQVLRDLSELGALDWAQDSLMLDDVEIQRMLDDVPAPEAFGDAEWTDAWTPGTPDDDDSERPTLGEHSMTSAASTILRQREQKLREAKTEEERQQARRETAVYRVSLIFADEEAEAVKAVLEPSPAKNLLAVCRKLNDG